MDREEILNGLGEVQYELFNRFQKLVDEIVLGQKNF